jgi:hypothetical protein
LRKVTGRNVEAKEIRKLLIDTVIRPDALA